MTIDRDPTLGPDARPTGSAIKRHLLDAPRVNDTDTPAILCHVVVAHTGALQGSLSETPEGGLRLLSPTTNGSHVFVEQFFDYKDVVVFAVLKEIQVESPLIVLPGSTRRS